MLMKHKQINAFQAQLQAEASFGLDISRLKHIETRTSQRGPLNPATATA